MVIAMVLVVILRYGFQIGSIALQESITYLNCLIFTLGVAYTLKEDAHVRVDIVYSKLSMKKKGVEKDPQLSRRWLSVSLTGG